MPARCFGLGASVLDHCSEKTLRQRREAARTPLGSQSIPALMIPESDRWHHQMGRLPWLHPTRLWWQPAAQLVLLPRLFRSSQRFFYE